VGLLMLFIGAHKVLNPGSIDFIGKQLVSIDFPQALAYGVYVEEVIAALMIIFGIFSRLLTLTDHGGYGLELQVFFLLTGLAVFFLGSGRFAVKPD